MSNNWSENRIINTTINVLIYLLAINIFHYGQLLLPVICLLIFISNKYHFYVKNKTVFIVLCLFAVCFLLFAYQNGFYCVMGFCLPMAYYVGSNYKYNNISDIKHIIYLIAFGMVSHLLLNAGYELYRFGFAKFICKVSRYDIWLQSKQPSTQTALNIIFTIACVYYLLIYEKNNWIKWIGTLLFLMAITYTTIMRRRASLLFLAIIFVFSLIYDLLINKNRSKKIMWMLLSIAGVILFLIICYLFNLFNFNDYLNGFSVLSLLLETGLKSGRLTILLSGIKYMPSYLFGGCEISNIINSQFHDLLFDIYDYAGIVCFLIMATYCVLSIISFIKFIKNKIALDKGISLLLLSCFIGVVYVFCLDPIMTGSSLFLICAIILQAVASEGVKNEK